MQLPFLQWLSSQPLIGGDWRFFWRQNTDEFLSATYAWDTSLNTGIGKSNLEILWLNSYLGYGGHFLVNVLHIPWNISEKILFFWPVLIFSIISPYVLSGVFIKNKPLRILSSLIFLTNTYTLMIAAGGQVGIVLSYAVAPLTVYFFVRLLRNIGTSVSSAAIPFALMCSLQILFEPRMFLITSLSFLVFGAVYSITEPGKKSRLLFIRTVALNMLISMGIVLLLHSFWILPVVFSLSSASSFTTLSTVASADFYSFTRFENAFSLLHPNWPENIFGKTYFMKFQFLLLPLIGFGSMWFMRKQKKQSPVSLYRGVLCSSLLVILGTLLAKGTNDPFGAMYRFLTMNIPGFVAFRDASKFFLLISIGYSMLIPAGLELIAKSSMLKKQVHASAYLVGLFVLIWIGIQLPSFTGDIQGTFTKHAFPEEYAQLYEKINADSEFYRTLWVPQNSRFTPTTNTHPAVSLPSLIPAHDAESIAAFFSDVKSERQLQMLGIRYVVLPSDPYGELYLRDRTYNQDMYNQIQSVLDTTPYLSPVQNFGNMRLYEVVDPYGKFMTTSIIGGSPVSYMMANPTDYTVRLEPSSNAQYLLFSEGYDPHWQMIQPDGGTVVSQETPLGLNSFPVTSQTTGTYRIYYSLQDWVYRGRIVSAVTLAGMGIFWLSRRKHYDRT